MNTHLHCDSLQDSVLLHTLDVVHGETDQEVHDDDGHDDHEQHEQGLGGVHVGHGLHVLVVVLVVEEEIVILHLPAGHDQGLDDGVDEVAEVLLVAEEDGEPEREGNNEEENHDGDFDEGVAHIDEHHNIDSKEWHFPEHM